MKTARRILDRAGLCARALRAGAGVPLLVICAVPLGSCSIPIADLPFIGVPADAPKRSENPPPYLPVNDVPPPRDEVLMTVEQQKKAQQELLAARDKQHADAEALAKDAAVTQAPPAPKQN